MINEKDELIAAWYAWQLSKDLPDACAVVIAHAFACHFDATDCLHTIRCMSDPIAFRRRCDMLDMARDHASWESMCRAWNKTHQGCA